jgi:predicted nucleic acid-binding protein
MYAAGVQHPNKASCVTFLERVAKGEIEAALDAETLQEILHRYRALRRWAEGRCVYDQARKIFPTVLPIGSETVDLARELMDRHRQITARDATHAAVVLTHHFQAICSFDHDFDAISAIRRVQP